MFVATVISSVAKPTAFMAVPEPKKMSLERKLYDLDTIPKLRRIFSATTPRISRVVPPFAPPEAYTPVAVVSSPPKAFFAEAFIPVKNAALAMPLWSALTIMPDTPPFEWGVFGLYVNGLPAADIRRLGLIGYAENWAESGIGRSVANMSHDPWPIFVLVQLRISSYWQRRIVMY